MFLIEYSKQESVNNLLKNGGRIASSSLPVRTPFLVHQDNIASENLPPNPVDVQRNEPISEDALFEKLSGCDSVRLMLVFFIQPLQFLLFHPPSCFLLNLQLQFTLTFCFFNL